MAEKKEEFVQLALSGVPQSLIDELDEVAVAESRSRSAQTILLLKEILAIKRSMAGGGGNRTRPETAEARS
jgi:hypothetical protein